MVSGISSSGSSSIYELRQQMFRRIGSNEGGSSGKSGMAGYAGESSSMSAGALSSSLGTDQSGLIGMLENDSGLAKMDQQMKGGGMSAPPPPPGEVFDTADADGDGYVTEDELTAVLGDGGGDISELFSRVDTDGDGLISEAEDEAFRESMASTEKNGLADGGTGGIGGQDWRARMFETMQQGFSAAASSGFSTSFYA
ncbi:MAG: EF-hand domain-containing protein [Syntrophaceae bacterium]|nr:EF-hand domain-containing protein [Syntrophaceae bacterium]